MNRLLFICTAAILLLASSIQEASAQRTSQGEVFVGMAPYVSGYTIPSGGLGIEAGQYLLHSLWKVELRAVDWNQKVAGETDETAAVEGGEEVEVVEESAPVYFDHVLWNLSGNWMYRLLASYDRRFNLYVGAGAFVGLNKYEVFHKLPEEMPGEFPDEEFVYGAEPRIDIEFFPFRRAAVVLGLQSPLTLSSSLKTDQWHVSASLGVRINL